MPRLPRVKLKGAVYYVTSEGSQDQVIFKEKADYDMYVTLVKKYKEQHGFRLYSYGLLADRLHLVIETGESASISEIMHDLNSVYTKYFNARYNRRGHLFEARFRSMLVEKAHHLLELTRYVHKTCGFDPSTDSTLRPGSGQAGSPQAGSGQGGAAYSSFHLYKDSPRPEDPNMTQEIAEVKAFLENRDDPAAYEKYCLAGGEDIEDLAKKLRRGSILGPESFHEAVKAKVEEHAQARPAAAEERPMSNRVLVAFVGLAVIVTTASSVYLYISKSDLRRQYNNLLRLKEAEFAQKARFENISPLALTELENTEWEIEMVPLAFEKPGVTVKDKVRFKDGQFSSDYFSGLGFGPASMKLTLKARGAGLWEARLSKPNGDRADWFGDWQGDVMKGNVRFKPAGNKAQDFSFFSNGWKYASETVSQEGQPFDAAQGGLS